jgi:hypothetical protein
MEGPRGTKTMKITREVIHDLWPIYQSGEASAASRKLVEEFLKSDPELERTLREDVSVELLADAPIRLEPDHEMKALNRTKRALVKQEWPLFLAMMFSCFAFGRIVSDTSWDVSPRNFIITAAIAAMFWVWFFVRLARRLAMKA